MTLVELLLERLTGSWVRGHEHAGAGTVDPGLPRTFTAHDMTVLVELLGGLTEVVHVSFTVLGVVVRRAFAEVSVDVQAVAHDHTGDPLDDLHLVGRGDNVDRPLAALLALIDPRRSGLQWKERVGDRPGFG